MLSGFKDVIPEHAASILEVQDVVHLLIGVGDISVDDWATHTDYHGFAPDAPQISWFWRLIAAHDQSWRTKLFKFASGLSRVPVGGFEALPLRFQLVRSFESESRLPTTHTCFFQLVFPAYTSYEQMTARFEQAVSGGCGWFGME